jgi:transcriptional regulator with XRE-family HTH domain
MGTKAETAARLRQLPEILGKKNSDLAEICGVTPQQVSNYKSDTEHNNEIPWRSALAIWKAYGVPMEWIYDGQTVRVSGPEMREKLARTDRAARADGKR